MQHVDTRARFRFESLDAIDLVPERSFDLRCCFAPFQNRSVNTETLELIHRKIDASAVQILGRVADEVRELERDAELHREVVGRRIRWLQDRHHLQSDDRGRAVDVLIQVLVRGVLGHGEIHAHGMQESFEMFARDLPAQDRIHNRPAHRIVRTPTFEVGEECIAPGAQPVGLLLIGQCRSQIVDDLIGVPREAVQRVDVGPLAGREQQCREVVGLAVGRIELPAPFVGRT